MSKDSPFPDEPTSIDTVEYLNYVRALPCLIKGKAADPHHLKAVGAGRKRQVPKWEDYTAVPLQRVYHGEVEQIGIPAFNEKYKIDIILAGWKEDYDIRKTNLAEFTGDFSEVKHLIEYNMMCCEAMVLHECILELQESLVNN